ncbi:hypothetical protein BDR26DRAFT_932912 [Obelidium mucronatum]|nr:hypothetical protein BDR26DRAFT_932912 [Obelidium mucronatum]
MHLALNQSASHSAGSTRNTHQFMSVIACIYRAESPSACESKGCKAIAKRIPGACVETRSTRWRSWRKNIRAAISAGDREWKKFGICETADVLRFGGNSDEFDEGDSATCRISFGISLVASGFMIAHAIEDTGVFFRTVQVAFPSRSSAVAPTSNSLSPAAFTFLEPKDSNDLPEDGEGCMTGYIFAVVGEAIQDISGFGN